MRSASIGAFGLLSILAGCTTPDGAARVPSIAHANPASIAASPSRWDGREVEVVGLLVWQFENLGLYQSYGAYCRGGEKVAISADWQNWPGITKADNRREVVVRGIFRN